MSSHKNGNSSFVFIILWIGKLYYMMHDLSIYIFRQKSLRCHWTFHLVKDKIGIRKCLLSLFLQARNYTTCEVYDYLKKQGFEVNYRGVSAMVGQMHTRLGILRIYLKREHRCYS